MWLLITWVYRRYPTVWISDVFFDMEREHRETMCGEFPYVAGKKWDDVTHCENKPGSEISDIRVFPFNREPCRSPMFGCK